MLAETLTDQGELKQAIDILPHPPKLLDKTNDQMQKVVDRLIDLGELDLSVKLIEKNRSERNGSRCGSPKYFRGRIAVLKPRLETARTLLLGRNRSGTGPGSEFPQESDGGAGGMLRGHPEPRTNNWNATRRPLRDDLYFISPIANRPGRTHLLSLSADFKRKRSPNARRS